MKQLWLICLVALSSSTCFAQNSEQYQACTQKANTQSEINICANEEAKRVDIDLNRVYGELLSKAKSDPIALTKIRKAERAWVAYRDAFIDAMYPAKDKQAEYGSEFPMEAELIKVKLTREQIAGLEEILKKYSGI
jgi:uncharacterized protein YecT (DUF1311 family)